MLQPVRGTRDIWVEESKVYRHVADTSRLISRLYGYQEISTPIFEFSEVFQRTLGDSSDIVTKEMYKFQDKAGDWVTLRPENTAGVARAVISGGYNQNLPLKLFYSGPMFRYERPQKGRLRQFHQTGVELLGVAEPLGDVEIIGLGYHVLGALGLSNKVTLELNTLGDTESRADYKATLVEYFQSHCHHLSEESNKRLARNPLRILDSKDEADRQIIAEAPKLENYLNLSSKKFFDEVCSGLDALSIDYKLNPNLVRGLDYYCHTAFEFTTNLLGSQGAVLAGGRYDGLIKSMGGPATAGVGWAAGIERLSMLVDEHKDKKNVIVVIPVGPDMETQAFILANRLRKSGFYTDYVFRGNLSKRLKKAHQLEARYAVIIGSEELSMGNVTIRDLDSGRQEEISKDNLESYLSCSKA